MSRLNGPNRVTAAGLGVLLAASVLATSPAGMAAKARRGNVLERHPVATGIGAAVIAHHTGKRRVQHGGRKNLAQRHPIATGVVAGAVAHHMGKKHRAGR